MADDLVRFSVAVPDDLLASFDELVNRRGVSRNRSEAIRDLMRLALEEEECEHPCAYVIGTLTIVYNHHANDLKDKLDGIQHSHCENVVSTLHVHLDQHNCLETIILRGRMELVRDMANQILGTKGVKTGKLVCSAIEDTYAHAQCAGHQHEARHQASCR